ncbi:hypothetical protein M0R19_02865 [Candidatus Pacearchaeota archaeon]|jgi:hypothetical protein|nr:hypothetical protein [Candidatus Pacearchaeota archaeon]
MRKSLFEVVIDKSRLNSVITEASRLQQEEENIKDNNITRKTLYDIADSTYLDRKNIEKALINECLRLQEERERKNSLSEYKSLLTYGLPILAGLVGGGFVGDSIAQSFPQYGIEPYLECSFLGSVVGMEISGLICCLKNLKIFNKK